MGQSFEETMEKIKEQLPWANEDVIGCSLSNYGDPYICSARNAGCRSLVCCQLVQQAYRKVS